MGRQLEAPPPATVAPAAAAPRCSRPPATRYCIDGTGMTSRAKKEYTFRGWVKANDGQEVISSF